MAMVWLQVCKQLGSLSRILLRLHAGALKFVQYTIAAATQTDDVPDFPLLPEPVSAPNFTLSKANRRRGRPTGRRNQASFNRKASEVPKKVGVAYLE